MLTITSAQNPRVRALRALRDAKTRAETGLFLAEGGKLCAEALRDAEVATLLVDSERLDAYAALIALADDVIAAPAHVVAAVAEARTPQGIVTAVRMPASLDLTAAAGPLLALDGVQDPGNVGTMLRTAEAAGFRGALLSDACADAFAPKTVRASMGGVLRLPVFRGNLPDALLPLGKRGYRVIAAELGGVPPREAFRGCGMDTVLVIGGEGSGVSPEVSEKADARVTLAMRGRAESLNAAVAAGILMYGFAESLVP